MSMNAMASESSWHTETSAAPWIKLQKVQRFLSIMAASGVSDGFVWQVGCHKTADFGGVILSEAKDLCPVLGPLIRDSGPFRAIAPRDDNSARVPCPISLF